MNELNCKLADTGLTIELIEREDGGRDCYAVYVLEHRVPGRAGIKELGFSNRLGDIKQYIKEQMGTRFCKQYGIEV